MKRVYVVSISTDVPSGVEEVHVSVRRLLAVSLADSFQGESEEAVVHEVRVAWRQLRRRLRDIDDGRAP